MADTQNQLLSKHARQVIDEAIKRYPEGKQRSAVFEALRAAQHENHGYLSVELMDAVADYLKLEPIKVYEVATFYSMFETKPVGRHSISVCTNISCMLRGGNELYQHVQKRLGIGHKEVSPNGTFSLEEVECMGACTGAPAMQVNYDYYENLTPAKIDELIEKLGKNGKD